MDRRIGSFGFLIQTVLSVRFFIALLCFFEQVLHYLCLRKLSVCWHVLGIGDVFLR